MKYATRHKANHVNEDDLIWLGTSSSIEVFEDDTPIPTGLLDANGNELYRVVERNSIGFKVRR